MLRVLQSSKNRRGGTLWRSARERKAWLKDARRALHSQDASCSAYVVSVLVDRAQPLLKSLQRASKRAEKELAEFGAVDAATLAEEGTPAPQAEEGWPGLESDRAGSQSRGKKRGCGEGRCGSGGPGDDMPPASKRPRTAVSQVWLWANPLLLSPPPPPPPPRKC
jgi:hypothetical protein